MSKARRIKQQRHRLAIPDEVSVQGMTQSIVAHLAVQQGEAPRTKEGATVSGRFVVSVATNAWRLKQRMLDMETGEPREGMDRVYRHVEAIADALKELGVETVDHVGQVYDTGSAVKVVTSEKRTGLKREEITETLKPTIRWQGKLLQQGEVVVGVPDAADDVPAKAEHPTGVEGEKKASSGRPKSV